MYQPEDGRSTLGTDGNAARGHHLEMVAYSKLSSSALNIGGFYRIFPV